MASPVKDTAWLEWMAGLMGAGSRQRRTAILPPNKFHCLLDELPLHLIPRHSLKHRRLRAALPQPLFFNSNCLVLPAGEIPEEFQTRGDLLEGFHLPAAIAWVRDSETDAINPFWLGQALAETLSNLQSGRHSGHPVPDSLLRDSLGVEMRMILAAAGILIEAKENVARSTETENEGNVSSHAIEFQKKNYTPIRGLIHPFHLAALRRYYRHQIRNGAIWLGDEQSSRRYVAHNEPVARFFHHQLAKVVGRVVGEKVKPSYVYLGSYLSGAELKKHTDREQCEFSVTLSLDFSPEPDLATSWPIRLDTPDGSVAVYQALGDGLVYRGTKVPHYRTMLGEGHSSTSIFFHYVAEDFSGPLD